MKATDRTVLSRDNRRLIIGPITKKDAGAYRCEVSNTFISRLSDPVSLLYSVSDPSSLLALLVGDFLNFFLF